MYMTNVRYKPRFMFIYFILLIIFITNCDVVQSDNGNEQDIKEAASEKKIPSPAEIETTPGCVMMDGICVEPGHVSSYEAIRNLHGHLDDDKSGDIDISESDDFLRGELNYTKGLEKRQSAFHHNNDQHINVLELWNIWLSSDVHRWSVEQTVAWLYVSVELGQYADVFYANAVNGSLLPRLANKHDLYLTRILKITNLTHRSKICIKAMDIVLFGPPKGSLVKDVFIASLIAVIVVLLLRFRKMNKDNCAVVKKMDQEMEMLQKELYTFHIGKKREEGNEGKKASTTNEGKEEGKERGDGEREAETKTQTGGGEGEGEGGEGEGCSLYSGESEATDVGYPESECELDQHVKSRLQLWLQLGYELERASLEDKIKAMEMQFEEAKNVCEKMKAKSKNLLGAFSFIHGKIETKGQPIMQAKAALYDIKRMDKEMQFRWNKLENLLNVPLIKNAGLDHLQVVLEPHLQTPISHSTSSAVGIEIATGGGGGGGGGKGGGAAAPEPSFRQSLSENSFPVSQRRRKRSRNPIEGSFVSLESPFPSPYSSLRLPATATDGLVVGAAPFVAHSQTVGAGISKYEGEPDGSVRLRGSSSEAHLKKRSTESLKSDVTRNSNNNNNNGDSTDETDSLTFTVGDNPIRIDRSAGSLRVGTPTPPAPQCPLPPSSSSSSSLQGHTEEAPPASSSSRASAPQVPDKNLNKYWSDPSLDIGQPSPLLTPPPPPAPSKGEATPKTSKMSKFFKMKHNKSDKK